MHPLPSRALLSLGHVTCIPRKEVAKAEEEEERRERVGPRLARPRDSSKVLLVWGSPLSAATLPTIALELSIRTSNAARRLRSPRRHDDVSVDPSCRVRSRVSHRDQPGTPVPRTRIYAPRLRRLGRPPHCRRRGLASPLGAQLSCACVCATYVSLSLSPLASRAP